MIEPWTLAIIAVDHAYSDGVRKLFEVLRSETTTNHGRVERPIVAFVKGLQNLNLVRQSALKAIKESEEKST
jgi:hypothetical protein